MPTGTCRYPEHHRPSAGQPIAWLVILAIGAVIIANWHAVIVALVVTAVLAVFGIAVVLLLHNHHRHYDPELERRAALDEQLRHVRLLAGRSAELELGVPQPAGAPAVHHHLHLHGLGREDVAAITRQALNQTEEHYQ